MSLENVEPGNPMGKNLILKNCGWGFISHFIQTILLSLFFVFIARAYSVEVFASFIIATTIYQLIVSFSGLGLNQWFVREIIKTSDKPALSRKFFKMQFILGIVFYLVSILLSFALYQDTLVRSLSLLVGINIVFDNIINAIKSLNVAEFEQKRTFKILTVDSVLRFLIGALVLIIPYSIVLLCVLTIFVRGLTLRLFLKMGSSNEFSFVNIWKSNLSFYDLRNVVISNWPFIIISAASIINWRMANIIISKVLPIQDVAHFEISYKIFSVAQWIPIILSSTIFPLFNKYRNTNNTKQLRDLFLKTHFAYLIFGILSYTFVFSFSDVLVPLLFGSTYIETSTHTKEMFLTMLVLPIVFLQANLLVALNKERVDMWINLVSLIVNVVVCFIGLTFLRSLWVINWSIFISFFVFQVLQDIYLFKKEILSAARIRNHYLFLILSVALYFFIGLYAGPAIQFLIFWMLIFSGIIVHFRKGLSKMIYSIFYSQLQNS